MQKSCKCDPIKLRIGCQTTNYQHFIKYYRYFLDTFILTFLENRCQIELVMNGDLKMNKGKSCFPETPFWVGI